jgi:hypothetical protein
MRNFIQVRKEYKGLRKELLHATDKLREHGDYSLFQLAGWIVTNHISFGEDEKYSQFYKGEHALYYLDKISSEYFGEADIQMMLMEGFLDEMKTTINFATLLDTLVMDGVDSFVDYQNTLV